MKYVLLYESDDDARTKAPIHFPAHSARAKQFHTEGKLLMSGPFADAQTDGAMSIFTTREAALEFIDGDPFVIHGLVKGWEIREWNEGLT